MKGLIDREVRAFTASDEFAVPLALSHVWSALALHRA
jgi:hypothetical protein